MAGANVSREALKKVKKTLNQFKIDIRYLPDSMMRHIAVTEENCLRTIKKLKGQISELTQIIVTQERKMTDLKDRYENNRNRISEQQARINHLNSEIGNIRAQIQSLNNQLAAFNSQMMTAETNREKAGIQSQIVRVQSEIQEKNGQIHACEYKMNAARGIIKDLENENVSIQREIDSLKADTQRKKKEKSREEDILERMNAAFSILRQELAVFKLTIVSFTNNAINEVGNNLTGVEQCLQIIEEYLKTSL